MIESGKKSITLAYAESFLAPVAGEIKVLTRLRMIHEETHLMINHTD